MLNKVPPDPYILAVISSIFGIVGTFGLFDRLGLSADQVVMVGGYTASGITAAVIWWRLKKEEK